ncbi:MAG: hypothetical protein RBT59_13285 [Arcobacteraceae bacterium]|jgi:hypothetical protein|nr:hypothetical protein [Arcobacteraceae bacterium]
MEIDDLENLEKDVSTGNTSNNEEENTQTISNTIEVTPKQQEITKQIAIIDNEIETLSKVTISEDDFYDNIDDILTDEDRYLQEENPKEYLKVVDKKKKEYLESKSNGAEIEKKEKEKADLQYASDIEDGLKYVTKIYKDYNHNQSAEFFATKLSKEQQEEIYKKSADFGEVFKFAHEKYLEANGKQAEIKNQKAPTTINLNNITQTSLKNKDIIAIDSEDEKYSKALGR